MTEFVPAGILPEISNAFSVSIPTAALLTSVYALAVGVSGPVLTAASIHLPRKALLLGLMSLFVIGSLVSALAPDFSVLMLGRIISALCHGAFIGVGAVVATRLVEPKKSASAIALMFTGSTLANIAGVPLGTILGQSAGWREVFWSLTRIFHTSA
jgi:DHA1 family inner membrane transport protein